MEPLYAKRMGNVHRSFIREILKVTASPDIISFAGGLPNPELFPLAAMEEAAATVLRHEGHGRTALQYSTTEGDPGLREWIAERYRTQKGLDVDADDVIVCSGSQQSLDLVGKVFIDPEDTVLIERPGYLGAIQAFSMFEPEFVAAELDDEGVDPLAVEAALAAARAKLYYAVPNFQNPSGVTYSGARRDAVARLVDEAGCLFVEDDPYGELRFRGTDEATVCSRLARAPWLLLGTFSKIAAPGFRIGWIVAKGPMRDKLVVAKQASDLHTSTLGQRILLEYLKTDAIDGHIERIRERYGRHRDAMLQAIDAHFPKDVHVTRPDGGMFLWARLPGGASAMELLDRAVERKVAFVPGIPFYADGGGTDCLRLNFSNASVADIAQGIERLGACLRECI